MDEKEIIARRVALEIQPGALVNLGIGLPTMVARYVRQDAAHPILFQSENGIIGMAAPPMPGAVNPDLSDAGGNPITCVPGAASFDSCMSFGLIRGGHLDLTVLGGLQVDGQGRLANWMVPGKLVPGMGGAMDLVTGAKRVIVAMQHTAKGEHKIVETVSLPLTSARPVALIVTEMAVIEPTPAGLVLKERGPGVSVAQVIAATGAKLIVEGDVPEMILAV